ncbi:hypothetical protein V6N11_064737 [Hibiscus sabdariffa]|uniref:Uncharacterized protein n=2 Tax=Hibiscus sabdariffa TaxID=183260 RepID=A0ABR2SIL3_9ROSI
MSSSGEGSNGGLVMNEGGTDTDVREWYRRLVCVGYCGRLVLGVSVKGSNDGEDLERWMNDAPGCKLGYSMVNGGEVSSLFVNGDGAELFWVNEGGIGCLGVVTVVWEGGSWLDEGFVVVGV